MFNIYSPAIGITAIAVAIVTWFFDKRMGGVISQSKKSTVPPRPIEPSVSPERERELSLMVCPEIRAVLEDELRAGNRIISGGRMKWALPDSLVISLGFIFKSEPKALPHSLIFNHYDIKTADGDSIYCAEHLVVVCAAMPTLAQHMAPDVLVGHRREERLRELAN